MTELTRFNLSNDFTQPQPVDDIAVNDFMMPDEMSQAEAINVVVLAEIGRAHD